MLMVCCVCGGGLAPEPLVDFAEHTSKRVHARLPQWCILRLRRCSLDSSSCVRRRWRQGAEERIRRSVLLCSMAARQVR